MNFYGKEEKKSSSSSSSKSMILSRSDEARQLPLSSSREAFLSPRNVFSRAKMQGFYVSRADEQSSSFLEAHIARRFLLFSEDHKMILVKEIRFWLVV